MPSDASSEPGAIGAHTSVTKAGKVRGDEGELVAAGEEAEEDQRDRTGRGTRAPARRPSAPRRPRARRRGRRRAGTAAPASAARIAAAKTRNTPDQGITVSSPSASGGPITCPADPAAVAIAERHRPVLGRRGPADDGEDHAEAGARDAEADQHVEQLVPLGRRRERRQHQPGRIEDRAGDDRPAVAESLGDAPRRSAGRSPRRGSGWRWRARTPPAASRTRSAIGSWNTPKLARMPKLTERINEPATRTGVIRRDCDMLRLRRTADGDAARRGVKTSRRGRPSRHPEAVRAGTASLARIVSLRCRDTDSPHPKGIYIQT